MSTEAVNAGALGAAGIGIPGVMWASDKLGYQVPHWEAELALLASIVCILVSLALWGHLIFRRMGASINWSLFDPLVPLHVAARRVYEAAESAAVLDLMISKDESAESKLNHFKMLLLVDERVRLPAPK
ncbi:MAG TPA: hypothetical protein VHX43_01195 [Xanthobacteraceae bacterium]|jgi:hypothetical protein|nr:hypothetical protein [Xanthobacteraceae bacterium]